MSNSKKTPPIEPIDYLGGVKVVDIGDIRVARGMSRRPFSACQHKSITYDKQERRIRCEDCETDLEGFDAFLLVVEQYDSACVCLERRKKEIDEAESFAVRSIAAKNIDLAWRSRSTVPVCPHCGHGLFPERFKNGIATMGREYAEALLKRAKAKKDAE